MAFLRTLVVLLSLLFVTLVVGHVAVWRVPSWLGLGRGEWPVFAAYTAATVWLAFS